MAEIRLQIHKNQHQITPAVVNAFQANNLVDNLVFTMANYTDGDTDFSKMKCYAICYGVLGLDEIILPTRINDAGELEITWTLDSYTLSIGQNIYYQIVFKDADATVLTTYKAIILCNESIPADEHIVAQYPTILKQIERNIEINITNISNEVDGKLDDMTEKVNSVVASDAYYLMNYDEPIPLDQRANGKLYLQRLNDYDYSCIIEDFKGNIIKPSASGISFDAGAVGSSATNVQTFLEELHSQAKGRTRFCVNEGNVDEEGSADLLGEISSEGLLVIKSGGEYKNIIATKANGITFECGEIPSVDCNGYPTGDYNVFLSEDSTISLLKNNVHTEPLEPQYPEINDVWHDVVNRESKIYLEFEEALKLRNSNYSVTFNDVAVNGDVCVVASNGGIYASIDRGATWKSAHAGNYQCVIYANNMFVAAGSNGNLATSLDGLTWVTKAKHGTDTIYNMIYDGTRYCAVTRANRVKYSESLDSWTTVSIVTAFVATDIDYHDGLYMVCGSNGEICVSGDGETWVSSTKQSSSNYTKIRHLVDQTWVAIMGTTSEIIHYTNDNGASWGSRSVNQNEIVTDIQYLDGEYTLTTTTNILKGVSLNGLTVVPNSENTHYTSIDKYVVVGSSGAIGTIGADIGWYTFDQVPIGSVYIYSGGVDDIYTNPYNNNGYDVTTYTVATPATYGVMRVAAPMDEVDCSCTDAGITPSNLYKLNDFRTANTEYRVGDSVGCAYHHNRQLKCIAAGTTSTEALNTSGELTIGQQIKDGTVTWQVDTSVSKIDYEVYGEIQIKYPEG